MGIVVQNAFTFQTPQLPDDRSGPFTTVALALQVLTPIRRARYLTVVITSENREYWFRDGTADSDLIPKGSGEYIPTFRSTASLPSIINSTASIPLTALTAVDQTTPPSGVKVGSLIIDTAGRFGVISTVLDDTAVATSISVPSSGGGVSTIVNINDPANEIPANGTINEFILVVIAKGYQEPVTLAGILGCSGLPANMMNAETTCVLYPGAQLHIELQSIDTAPYFWFANIPLSFPPDGEVVWHELSAEFTWTAD